MPLALPAAQNLTQGFSNPRHHPPKPPRQLQLTRLAETPTASGRPNCRPSTSPCISSPFWGIGRHIAFFCLPDNRRQPVYRLRTTEDAEYHRRRRCPVKPPNVPSPSSGGEVKLSSSGGRCVRSPAQSTAKLLPTWFGAVFRHQVSVETLFPALRVKLQ
jgi:hypothetical protein